jgi:hypothetical protein
MRETEKELEEEGDVSVIMSVLRVTVPVDDRVNKGESLLDSTVVSCCILTDESSSVPVVISKRDEERQLQTMVGSVDVLADAVMVLDPTSIFLSVNVPE